MLGKMDCYGLTDLGKKRPSNEDQFLIADLNKSMMVQQTSLGLDDQTRLFGGSQGKLLLVADGMGGHAAGEQASTIAVDSISAYVLNTMRWFFRLEEDPNDFLDDLKSALEYCQEKVYREASKAPERQGMGTTVTMAYVIWPRMYVVHAGDSRCYLLRKSKLKQVTKDHTFAQQLVDQGTLDAEDAETSRWSHMLWNYVGGNKADLSPEVHKAELMLGDKLLLCTDGLTRHVPDEEIVELLGEHRSAEQACERLVRSANKAGGSDNITVVVAQFRRTDEQESLEGKTVSLEDVVEETQPRGDGEPELETGVAQAEPAKA